MMTRLYAKWAKMLKRLATGRHRSQSAAIVPLVSFSLKRQKKLGWNLFLCGRNR